MKKFALCLAVLVFLFTAVSCSNTTALDYNNKLSQASEYSFNIVYTDSASELPIYISCYKKNDEYAYRFSTNGFNNEDLAYRQIFVDDTFYEICESKKGGFWCGEFKKTVGVDVNYSKNFMFKYTAYITSGSFLTMFSAGEKVDYKGNICTKTDIAYEGATYTFFFQDETSNLVKFSMTNSEGTKTLEYSDYKFGDIDEECLIVPSVSLQIGTIQLYREVTDFTYEYFIS